MVVFKTVLLAVFAAVVVFSEERWPPEDSWAAQEPCQAQMHAGWSEPGSLVAAAKLPAALSLSACMLSTCEPAALQTWWQIETQWKGCFYMCKSSFDNYCKEKL